MSNLNLPERLGQHFEFVRIHCGEFLMGHGVSNDPDDDPDIDTIPVHQVHMMPFEIGKYPVTRGLWNFVMSGGRIANGDNTQPVVETSWLDIQEFLVSLNKMDPAYTYRLPSEAEWEYACRAVIGIFEPHEETYGILDDMAWFAGNSNGETHPVGLKSPNAWGLYDMLGNVWEWCQDWYHDSYEGAPVDGSPWEVPMGNARVIRGGSWKSVSHEVQVALRSFASKSVHCRDVGFRLARTARKASDVLPALPKGMMSVTGVTPAEPKPGDVVPTNIAMITDAVALLIEDVRQLKADVKALQESVDITQSLLRRRQ